MEDKRKKYTQDDYASFSKGCSYIKTCSKGTGNLKCICEQDDDDGFTCFKCGSYTHKCIDRKLNRGDKYECAPCINKAMDPLYPVRKVLVESYFKTDSIFEFYNQINFQFVISSEEYTRQIQVRGLKAGSTFLTWPMQGAFYLNDQKTPIDQMRPLQNNSSRKSRRDQYIIIPKEKLKMGKNYLRFRIIVLDRVRFKDRYQYEQTGIYYMAINSVSQITNDLLNVQTFRKRRVECPQTLALLSEKMGQIEVTQRKLSLICPYTRDRIKIPVRGKYCKHFNCVCLQTLARFHAKSRFWGCPLCQCRINEPCVDILIYNILKDNAKGTDVIIQKDGKYKWVQSQKPVQLSSDESNQPENQEQVSMIPLPVEVPQISNNLEVNAVQIIEDNNNEVEIVEPIPQVEVVVRCNQLQLQPETELLEDIIIFQEDQENKRHISLSQNGLIETLREQIENISFSKNEKVQKVHTYQDNNYIPIKEIQSSTPSNTVRNTKKQYKYDYPKKNKPVLADIPEIRYKQMSKDAFKRLKMPAKIAQEKQIAAFLRQHHGLQQVFKQFLTQNKKH